MMRRRNQPAVLVQLPAMVATMSALLSCAPESPRGSFIAEWPRRQVRTAFMHGQGTVQVQLIARYDEDSFSDAYGNYCPKFGQTLEARLDGVPMEVVSLGHWQETSSVEMGSVVKSRTCVPAVFEVDVAKNPGTNGVSRVVISDATSRIASVMPNLWATRSLVLDAASLPLGWGEKARVRWEPRSDLDVATELFAFWHVDDPYHDETIPAVVDSTGAIEISLEMDSNHRGAGRLGVGMTLRALSCEGADRCSLGYDWGYSNTIETESVEATVN